MLSMTKWNLERYSIMIDVLMHSSWNVINNTQTHKQLYLYKNKANFK